MTAFQSVACRLEMATKRVSGLEVICCRSCQKFYTDIHDDVLYRHTNYFRSEGIAEKMSKMPHPMASSGIYRERFK